MATWQPPIPSGAMYSRAAVKLGVALPLLGWCYDAVQRDGTFTIRLKDAADDMGVPYQTLRRWWKDVCAGPFFEAVDDHGRNGYQVRFADAWIDWRMLNKRPNPEPVKAESSEVILESGENAEGHLKVTSRSFESSEMNLQKTAYKEDIYTLPTPNGVGRGAKRARAPTPPQQQGELALTPLAIYRHETGAKSPKPAARELIATVTDLDMWRTACRNATQRAWNVQNIENLVRHYEELRTGTGNEKRNGHRPHQPIRQAAEPDPNAVQWRTGAARYVNGSADRNGHAVPPVPGADRTAGDARPVEGTRDPLLE